MKILCMALYGSCARGEETSGSDIDLFAIHNQNKYQMIVRGRVNIALYPHELAIKIMKSGNLFALHLRNEGIPVFNDSLYEDIISYFRHKDCYTEDITKALFLAEYIVHNHNKIKNIAMMNKRISWCARTILIAISTELKTPYFSTGKLSTVFHFNELNSSDIINIIELKNIKYKDIDKLMKASVFFDNIKEQRNISLDAFIPDYFIRKSIDALSSDNSFKGCLY